MHLVCFPCFLTLSVGYPRPRSSLGLSSKYGLAWAIERNSNFCLISSSYSTPQQNVRKIVFCEKDPNIWLILETCPHQNWLFGDSVFTSCTGGTLLLITNFMPLAMMPQLCTILEILDRNINCYYLLAQSWPFFPIEFYRTERQE